MNRYLVTVNIREFGGDRLIQREYDVTAKSYHDARLNALYQAGKEGLFTCGVARTEFLTFTRQ